ncbi:asparagine synthase [Rubrivivax albus]|uniref:asparagine synthase (glutamine-hydrolyzing) n=2 Tax=Rubrivivax albus TaxID=2499835 RepID=A0A3S2W055_9BURK|nr:asparagine synthase [Rubrivivax albus]
MQATPTVFALGVPRFADARLAHMAKAEGSGAAWQAAVAGRHRDQAVAAAAATAGNFAVGLTDAQGRVFLAVDRFAEQTLCWRRIGDRIHYAERADTLAALHPRAEIDPQAVYDYLYFHVIPSPRTVFRGVHRLPPAHYLWFENGEITVEPYWLPQFTAAASANFDELAAAFRQRVRSAVAAELDGSKPACFLSGGTDSSTVAGMLKDVAGRAATYSIGFEAEGYDEMAFARIAARRFGTEHHEYYVTPDDLVRSIPDVAAHYDQPFGNSSVLPAYYCARMAREDGVTRLLAGDGGDELFGGNARYAKQRVFGYYDAVPAVLRSGVLEPLLEGTPLGALPLARKGRSYVQQAKVPLPERLQQYNLLQRMGVAQVFTPDFLARVDMQDTSRQQRQVWQLPPGNPSTLNRMLAFDWRYTLAEADLPKVRGSTSLAGVGVGFPLLDAALVDFSLQLPDDYKLKGQKLRWFFKEALRGFLPDEILVKKKQGFGLPFGVWATRHAGLKAFAADSLHSLQQRGIVQARFIDTLLKDHLPAHPGYYGEMVWILMMLEQWMQAQERAKT